MLGTKCILRQLISLALSLQRGEYVDRSDPKPFKTVSPIPAGHRAEATVLMKTSQIFELPHSYMLASPYIALHNCGAASICE